MTFAAQFPQDMEVLAKIGDSEKLEKNERIAKQHLKNLQSI